MVNVSAQPVRLELGIPGFDYADLHRPERLRALFETWRDELRRTDAGLGARYDSYLDAKGGGMTPETFSQLLVDVAPHVSRFVARLFRIEREWEAQRRGVEEELVVFRFKDEFVKRRAIKRAVSDVATARHDGLQALA